MVGLDQLAEEWLDEAELSWIEQLVSVPEGSNVLYAHAGPHQVIIHVEDRRLHYRVSGTLTRRKVVVIVSALGVVLPPFLIHVAEFLGTVLRQAFGP